MGYKVKNTFLDSETELNNLMEKYGFTIEIPDEEENESDKEENEDETKE